MFVQFTIIVNYASEKFLQQYSKLPINAVTEEVGTRLHMIA